MSSPLPGPAPKSAPVMTPEGIAVRALYRASDAPNPVALAQVGREAAQGEHQGWLLVDDARHAATLNVAVSDGVQGLWVECGDSANAAAQLVREPCRHPGGAWILSDGLAPEVLGTGWRWQQVAVDASGLAEQGANAAQEIAWALSACAHASERSGVRMSLDRDLFMTVAKLRAVRALWAATHPQRGHLFIHAVAGARGHSLVDPATNLLRETNEAISAIWGGADAITLRPFRPESAPGAANDALALRMTRNTQLILAHEAGLGRYADFCRGSFYVEALTKELAEAAWTTLQELGRLGGPLSAGGAAWLQERMTSQLLVRERAVHTRKIGVLGVTEYPESTERQATDPQKSVADGAAMARLRWRNQSAQTKGESPKAVSLLVLGVATDATARVNFAQNVFGCVGWEAQVLSSLPPSAALGPIVCLCGTDAAYLDAATGVASIAATLRRAVPQRKILVAGKPGANEQSWREAGVDAFIYMGSDVVEKLEGVVP